MLCSLTCAAALVLGGCSGGGHGSFTGHADLTRITEDVRFHHYPCTPVLWLILQETVDACATHTIVVAAGVGVKGHASPAKSPPELSRSNDDVSEFSPQDGGVTSGGRPSSFKHCLLLQDNLQDTSLSINKWSILKIFTCNWDFFNTYSFLVLANKPCCSSHRWWRWVGHWPSSSDTRLWQPWQAGCRDNTTEASHDNTSTSIKDIDFNQMVMPLIKYQFPTYNLQLQDYR